MRATLQLAGSGGALPPLRHPVETCLEVIDAAVDEAEQARCWSLSDAELIELLGAAQRACSRIEELRLRLVSEVDRRDTGKAVPATSTAAFLTACQRTSRRMAGRDVRLAADLDHSFEQVRSALGAGRVNLEQAQVICLSLRTLPLRIAADGIPDMVPPASVDPARIPIRHRRFRPGSPP